MSVFTSDQSIFFESLLFFGIFLLLFHLDIPRSLVFGNYYHNVSFLPKWILVKMYPDLYLFIFFATHKEAIPCHHNWPQRRFHHVDLTPFSRSSEQIGWQFRAALLNCTFHTHCLQLLLILVALSLLFFLSLLIHFFNHSCHHFFSFSLWIFVSFANNIQKRRQFTCEAGDRTIILCILMVFASTSNGGGEQLWLAFDGLMVDFQAKCQGFDSKRSIV